MSDTWSIVWSLCEPFKICNALIFRTFGVFCEPLYHFLTFPKNISKKMISKPIASPIPRRFAIEDWRLKNEAQSALNIYILPFFHISILLGLTNWKNSRNLIIDLRKWLSMRGLFKAFSLYLPKALCKQASKGFSQI